MKLPVTPMRELLVLHDSGTWGDEGTPQRGVPVLRSTNIQDSRLVLDDPAWRVLSARELERKRLAAGDILVTKSSGSADHIGKCCLFDARGEPNYYFSNFTLRLRTEAHCAEPRWLFYWLSSELGREVLRRLNNTTTGLRNLDVERYLDQGVPLPPVPEQRRIADILDKADSIRRKRAEAVAHVDDLLRATFLDMFGDPVTNPKGWPVATLGELAEEMRYGTSEKCVEEARPKALPVLRIPNVVGGAIDFTELKFLVPEPAERERLLLERGDLLFVRSNGNPEYIGRCAVFEEAREAIFASYLIRVRLASDAAARPDFAQAALSTPSYRKLLTGEARTTAGNYNISTEGLRRLRIPTPPRRAQERFTERRQALERHRTRLADAAVAADHLFDALVQRAFTGELTSVKPSGRAVQTSLFAERA